MPLISAIKEASITISVREASSLEATATADTEYLIRQGTLTHATPSVVDITFGDAKKRRICALRTSKLPHIPLPNAVVRG